MYLKKKHAFIKEGETFYRTNEIWRKKIAKFRSGALIDQEILETLEVGTINQLFYNTNLYNQLQYAAVKAKTWADKAFVMNVA